MSDRFCVGWVVVSTGVVMIELCEVPAETTAYSQSFTENPATPLHAEGNVKILASKAACRLANFICILRIFYSAIFTKTHCLSSLSLPKSKSPFPQVQFFHQYKDFQSIDFAFGKRFLGRIVQKSIGKRLIQKRWVGAGGLQFRVLGVFLERGERP